MAFPKGISQDAMRLKRENGTADTWLAEHKKQKEAGTLDAWLAAQTDLGVVASVSKPSEAKPARKPRGPLAMLRDAAFTFHGYVINSPLAAIDFSLDDLESLNELQDCLRAVSLVTKDAISHLELGINRLQREHELQIENDVKANRIAELEAQLAQAEERLRVTGNSEPVPSRANKKLTLKSVEPVT